MKWKKRTAFGRKQFIGSKRSRTKAMKAILKKDTKNVLNLYKERKELFNTIKKYQVGRGKVTNEGLRMALTELKYDHSNSLSKKEVNILVKELGVKGKMNKKTLINSQKFLKKKEKMLREKFKRTRKVTKDMKFFLPGIALGEMIAPIDQFMVTNDKKSFVANKSVFRQQLDNYKSNKINNEKVVENSFDFFNKKKKVSKFSESKKKKWQDYEEKSSQKHITTINKRKKIDELENANVNLKKEDSCNVSEKKNIPIKKVDNIDKDYKKEPEKKNKHKIAIIESKETYKNRYKVDLENRRQEYKNRYRIKRKEEALDKMDRYLNKDKYNISEKEKGVDKYRQKYLNKKEEEKERYRVDIAKKKEEYKDRYRIKKREESLEKKYERANKDKVDNKQKNNINKKNKNTSRIESNVMSANDYRGKGDREVNITEESLKHAFNGDNKTKSEKIEDKYRRKTKKRENIIKEIDNFVQQIEFSPAPHQEYINSKNKLSYIEIDTIKNEFLSKEENIENNIEKLKK